MLDAIESLSAKKIFSQIIENFAILCYLDLNAEKGEKLISFNKTLFGIGFTTLTSLWLARAEHGC